MVVVLCDFSGLDVGYIWGWVYILGWVSFESWGCGSGPDSKGLDFCVFFSFFFYVDWITSCWSSLEVCVHPRIRRHLAPRLSTGSPLSAALFWPISASFQSIDCYPPLLLSKKAAKKVTACCASRAGGFFCSFLFLNFFLPQRVKPRNRSTGRGRAARFFSLFSFYPSLLLP